MNDNILNVIKYMNFFKRILDEKMELKCINKLKNKNYYNISSFEFVKSYYIFKYIKSKKYFDALYLYLKLKQ